ncbi:peptidase M48 [Salinadaptatus halalkaliphilus]|uniref:Peptidase M48 n=1 Tax=Salinadaptatus halalkaliphilus TaxID=2419781 RepID=A0A4S3TRF6_9EURY|nr:M48 family metallopeptidase [Salinadaptatus halalkaliphilus]THE66240.1 peptidase M48 [Salinadaptatus halalkaliphilus]
MNWPTRVQLGLWVRMTVATIFAGFGQLVVLAFEFVVLAFMALIFLMALEEWLAYAFVLALLCTGLYVGWLVGTAPIRRFYPRGSVSDRVAHDGVANVVETIGNGLLYSRPITGWPTVCSWLVAALVGTFVAFGVTEATAWRETVDPLAAAAVVGLAGTLAHLAWVVHAEWTDDTAALSELEASVRVLESPPEELEQRRGAVQARVDRLARQADVPSPTVRLGASPTPTAATVGYRAANSTLVVSRGLVDGLEERELDAVLAHELAHVTNRDLAVVTALSVPAAYAWKQIERYEHPVVAVPGGVVIVAVRWSVAVVSRYREYVADQGAVAITGDRAALASALETLDRDLERRPSTDLRDHGAGTAFAIVPPPWEEHRFFDRTRRFVERTLFGTHPPTEKRIERLRKQS